MKRLQLICLVLVVSISFPPSSIVQADMAPPPAPGVGGLEPFKYQDTNVQMVFERVEMEVANIPQKDFNDLSQGDDKVNVNAWFMLHNLGKVEETMQVVFPLGNFNDCTSFQKQSQPPSYMSLIVMPETFTAAVNGVPVTISDVTTDHPHKDEGCTTMDWAAFNVTFPVNQDVLVRISYSLMNESVDAIENLEYVLETGSAWKGPITKGYVVLRFPYPVEDNILKGSTPGYTKLYNEIYWSFDNLEPTSQDNIEISFVEPRTWKQISDNRQRIQKNTNDANAWSLLAQNYGLVAYYHGNFLRSPYFAQKEKDTLVEGLGANPNSASLNAAMANFQFDRCCYFNADNNGVPAPIMKLLDKALHLDPSEPTAQELLREIQSSSQELKYTPPPTYTPSSLSAASLSSTPEATPTFSAYMVTPQALLATPVPSH